MVAGDVLAHHVGALVDLDLRSGVDLRDLLLVGEVEQGRPGVRHLDTKLGRRLDALLSQQVGGKARGLAGGRAERRGGKDVGPLHHVERSALEEVGGRSRQPPAVRRSNKAQVIAFVDDDAGCRLALVLLDRHSGVAHALGNALGDVTAIPLSAEVQNHAMVQSPES